MATLSHAEEQALRTSLKRLSHQRRTDGLAMAEKLYLVHKHHLYLKWGYTSFDVYVSQELSEHIETIRTYLRIYRQLIQPKLLSMEQVTKLGWTKANILARLALQQILTPANRDTIYAQALRLSTEPLRTWVQQSMVQRIPVAPPTLIQSRYLFSPDQHRYIQETHALAESIFQASTSAEQLVAICRVFRESVQLAA